MLSRYKLQNDTACNLLRSVSHEICDLHINNNYDNMLHNYISNFRGK